MRPLRISNQRGGEAALAGRKRLASRRSVIYDVEKRKRRAVEGDKRYFDHTWPVRTSTSRQLNLQTKKVGRRLERVWIRVLRLIQTSEGDSRSRSAGKSIVPPLRLAEVLLPDGSRNPFIAAHHNMYNSPEVSRRLRRVNICPYLSLGQLLRRRRECLRSSLQRGGVPMP